MKNILKFTIIIQLTIQPLLAADKANGGQNLLCDEKFEKLYLIKRSCILNADQQACRSLGAYYTLYPVLGSSIGASLAKTYNAFIEKQSGYQDFKKIINEQLTILKIHDEATKVYRSYDGDYDLAIKNATDPEVKRILQQAKEDNSGYGFKTKNYIARTKLLDSNFSSADNKAVDDLLFKDKGSYDDLSKKAKFKVDLFNAQKSDINVSTENVKNIQNKIEQSVASKKVNTKAAAVAGMAVFTIAPVSLSGGLTIIQKKQLVKCQNDLNLSKSELVFLTSTPMLSSPKASSSNPVTNFQCSSVQLNNPEEILTQIKLLNDNKIPAGVCQIMQNEMKQVDRLLGDTEMNPKDLSCNGFKDTNVTLSGSDESSTFTYKDGLHTYSAPWNTAQQYPILRSMQITDSDGKRDKNLESTFVSKYNMMHSPSQTEKSPGNLDLASSCLSDKSSVIDCKMVNAIMKARVYSSLKSQFCSNTASGLTPKDAPKIKANQ